MSIESFQAQRVERRAFFQVQAPPAVVFPLLCPVREREWIEGWQADMIYSQSGLAEADCVFTSPHPKFGLGTYVVSRYDRDWAIGFVIFYRDLVVKLDVALQPADGGTRVDWARTYTGLNAVGNAAVVAMTEEVFAGQMTTLARSLDDYCRRLQAR